MLLTDKFLELLNHAAPAKENLNIIRVFSKGVEKMDFPGSERDGDVYVPIKASARCERQHEEYSLHHKDTTERLPRWQSGLRRCTVMAQFRASRTWQNTGKLFQKQKRVC